MRIAFISVVPPFRGGIAKHSEVLTRHLEKKHEVKIFNYSRQYPNILFPGKSQYETETSSTSFDLETCVDSINPISWLKTARKIKDYNPNVILYRYWNPFFSPTLGTIARRLKSTLQRTKHIAVCDNIIPHETKWMDTILSKYFIKSMDGFIVQSSTVEDELLSFDSLAKFRKAPHPVYNAYMPAIEKETAKEKLGIKAKNIILYFGYVRHYKGFDILLNAVHKLKNQMTDFHLLAVGESYEGVEKYTSIIQSFGIENEVTWVDKYVPDSKVHEYFSAVDVVALPYRSASQSGIVQLAYHYNLPVVVTNVGGLPEIVDEGKSGYVVNPNSPEDVADCLSKNFKEDNFSKMPTFIESFKQRYSWENMVTQIEELVNEC
jgi:glycosyltransferase involved in cell wall biosynthesis